MRDSQSVVEPEIVTLPDEIENGELTIENGNEELNLSIATSNIQLIAQPVQKSSVQTLREVRSSALLDLYDNQNSDSSGFTNIPSVPQAMATMAIDEALTAEDYQFYDALEDAESESSSELDVDLDDINWVLK